MLYPVVLAGGSGTRLWPLAREHVPKQFLPLMGQRTMLQETVLRLDGMRGTAAPIVVCNGVHRFLAVDQLKAIGLAPQSIVLEPEGRNTAPALALAAHALLASLGAGAPDPLMLVMPSDHVIRDVQAFQAAVHEGARLAGQGYMVTFGVAPADPETGYGYIRRGGRSMAPDSVVAASAGGGGGRRGRVQPIHTPAAYEVVEFVEKPDAATARGYLEAGDYLWNSGVFLMRASVWLEELRRYRGDIAVACQAALAGATRDAAFLWPDPAAFASCPSDSIDYAVMERAAGARAPSGGRDDRAASGGARAAPARCAVVALDAGWSDVGSWSAVWDLGDRDAHGNTLQGDVYTESVRNALLLAHHRMVAAVGLEDVIVVETADAVLVARRDSGQSVKAIVARLKAEGRPEHKSQRRVPRPWGSYEVVDQGNGFQVKRLRIDPWASISLQLHQHRAEHWVVVSGTARVTRGDEVLTLAENESTNIPAGVKHRLSNPTADLLEIIEVQSGGYLEEDDIVRFEDGYNRATSG